MNFMLIKILLFEVVIYLTLVYMLVTGFDAPSMGLVKSALIYCVMLDISDIFFYIFKYIPGNLLKQVFKILDVIRLLLFLVIVIIFI